MRVSKCIGVGVLVCGLCAISFGDDAKKEVIARGQYLVTFGGCSECHSPKAMTAEGPRPIAGRALSGFPEGKKLPAVPSGAIGPQGWGGICSDDLTAWVGPWGTSFAANLTPDTETGLGLWTEEMFIKTMRTGLHQGVGRPILPPMPWYTLAPLIDDDLKAVFAYLQSIPAVKNRVPDPVPPPAAAAEEKQP